jgi:hypothetical protein
MSKLFILQLLVVALLSSQSLVLVVHSQNCVADSFNIEYRPNPLAETVNGLSVSLGYQINVKPNVMQSQQVPSEEAYAKKCLQALTVSYDTGVKKGVFRKEFDGKLSDLWKIDGLDFFTTYRFFDFKYLVTGLSESFSFLSTPTGNTDEVKKNVCFGTPGISQTLNVTDNLDNSVTFKWAKPAVVNAPKVCYYLIIVRDMLTGKETETRTTDLLFFLPKGDRKNRMRFGLSAYNDVSCWQNEYAYINDCRPVRTSSEIQYIELTAADIYSTPTTTQQSQVETTTSKGTMTSSTFSSAIFLLANLTLALFLYIF